MLVQDPGNDYRKEILKGRFYRCPAIIPSDALVIVRPICDGKVTETIAANIISYSNCENAFDHTPFTELCLKADEELAVNKVKLRRVLAVTKPDVNGLVKVAPIYTLKHYHSYRFNIDELINNEIAGIIYLKESDFNAEGFVSLMESFPIYQKFLEPVRSELNPQGISLLDDNLVMIYDLYSSSR